jgi:hypothetical protein
MAGNILKGNIYGSFNSSAWKLKEISFAANSGISGMSSLPLPRRSAAQSPQPFYIFSWEIIRGGMHGLFPWLLILHLL